MRNKGASVHPYFLLRKIIMILKHIRNYVKYSVCTTCSTIVSSDATYYLVQKFKDKRFNSHSYIWNQFREDSNVR